MIGKIGIAVLAATIGLAAFATPASAREWGGRGPAMSRGTVGRGFERGRFVGRGFERGRFERGRFEGGWRGPVARPWVGYGATYGAYGTPYAYGPRYYAPRAHFAPRFYARHYAPRFRRF